MPASVGLGHQQAQVTADHLVALVAEHSLAGRVDRLHDAVDVDGYDRIFGAVENRGELGDSPVRRFLDAFPFGHVFDQIDDPLGAACRVVGHRRTGAHPDRLAVLPQIPVLDDEGGGLAAADAVDAMADVDPILGVNEVNKTHGPEFVGRMARQAAVGGVSLHDRSASVGHHEADRRLGEGFAELLFVLP